MIRFFIFYNQLYIVRGSDHDIYIYTCFMNIPLYLNMYIHTHTLQYIYT